MKSRSDHVIFIVLCLCIGFFLPAGFQALAKGSISAKSLLKAADTCAKSLYRSREKMRFRHNWERCIEKYKRVYTRYPRSDEAAWALYRSGRLYTRLYKYSGMERDLDRALSLFRKLVKDYESHRLADDAQYRIGEIFYYYKNSPTQAYVEFLKTEIKFPSGDMRPKARAMMDRLAAAMSKKAERKEKKKSGDSRSALARVTNIRHWSTPTYTRVVIDLEKPVKYQSHILKADPNHEKPRRLYVDIQNAFVNNDIESSIPIRGGLLKRARAAQNKKDTVRVVLDINSIGGYKIFHLYDPFRIVVDVRGREGAASKRIAGGSKKTRPVRKGIRKVEKPDKSVSLARQLGLTVKRIVIDPGHGGKDPGCFLKGGIKEKDIVLQMAKILAAKIKKKLGCEVILTRTRDVFIPLDERTAFANTKKADLFISLHINAHKKPGVHGLETYFLNMATDARAVMVAARENATSEKNISDLQVILNSLLLNTKITESSRLAAAVQKSMVYEARRRYRNIKSLGVKQAPFYVLIGAEMPAILVETGFITNPTERKRLLSHSYQETLSNGIVKGVARYIQSIEQTFKGG
ncbi:MAG: N-acetylmuramoyl-L-alanine amidase [Deltaproteobacteria bacterium]|nr:N-acetylmuramoyl-L-alanine amidase [Deltaproteobacteria bacterium]MBW2016807.1 N-acetylmuramoyl-L-alanine amidase [Deltaproteobacteria bacterium]MBW2128441.1 N-acetylmuramoyl-L-alanine amidase [Deltaproteobacteria bacterium]MBW2303505.1 N-acetylmuramoyl-L-alanine amidase [Deltaproteobacteria bacterium]